MRSGFATKLERLGRRKPQRAAIPADNSQIMSLARGGRRKSPLCVKHVFRSSDRPHNSPLVFHGTRTAAGTQHVCSKQTNRALNGSERTYRNNAVVSVQSCMCCRLSGTPCRMVREQWPDIKLRGVSGRRRMLALSPLPSTLSGDVVGRELKESDRKLVVPNGVHRGQKKKWTRNRKFSDAAKQHAQVHLISPLFQPLLSNGLPLHGDARLEVDCQKTTNRVISRKSNFSE
ncbi:hypothetical protein F2P81_018681 [Scophthalmus maximus]|uniref:Uncharacterized protein n=1 Tax=Scophthalmus maximus TaxID=52904 RepID=A0A6A4S2Y9_SCOMX|nr:hypothetical protein F2P81_018681 [Scophthalmus maximus]